MKKILFASTECYPAAKVGGMADVVGSLPKYLNQLDLDCSVIIPEYSLPSIGRYTKESVFQHRLQFPFGSFFFSVNRCSHETLEFPLYTISLPGLFDRPSIYLDENGHGFQDELLRNLSFQYAILEWWRNTPALFDLIHCHDHMTGLIPFFMKHCPYYEVLRDKPSFFTLHNAMYRGRFSWENEKWLPPLSDEARGLLDWNKAIDSLACGLRSSWRVSTVSPHYLEEVRKDAAGIEWIFQNEEEKFLGILNGIDHDVWNTATDTFLPAKRKKGISEFKKKNKAVLTEKFVEPDLPLFIFIGRFAHQKGVDILISAIYNYLGNSNRANFFILGSGDKELEQAALQLQEHYRHNVHIELSYNEPLSHVLYAGADYILMPSRFEPCGLNQLFSMRYGTIPIVHATGGLVDTVPDIDEGGNGFTVQDLNAENFMNAILRGVEFHLDRKKLSQLRNKIAKLDFSWNVSAQRYKEEYLKLFKEQAI